MSTVPTFYERLAGWLLAFGSLALALVPMGGARLCLGHDGHVEWAGTAEGACACSERHAERAESGDTDSEPHGPCTDLEVVVPAFVHERDALVNAQPDAFDSNDLTWLVTGATAYAASWLDASARTRPPRSQWQRCRREDRRLDQRSASHRATVLLI